MLTDSQYETARRELDELNAWIDTKCARNGWASYRREDVPAHLQHVDNQLRSAVEYFEWMRDKPRKYFLYVNEVHMTAMTWTGGGSRFHLIWQSVHVQYGGRASPHYHAGVEWAALLQNLL